MNKKCRYKDDFKKIKYVIESLFCFGKEYKSRSIIRNDRLFKNKFVNILEENFFHCQEEGLFLFFIRQEFDIRFLKMLISRKYFNKNLLFKYINNVLGNNYQKRGVIRRNELWSKLKNNNFSFDYLYGSHICLGRSYSLNEFIIKNKGIGNLKNIITSLNFESDPVLFYISLSYLRVSNSLLTTIGLKPETIPARYKHAHLDDIYFNSRDEIESKIRDALLSHVSFMNEYNDSIYEEVERIIYVIKSKSDSKKDYLLANKIRSFFKLGWIDEYKNSSTIRNSKELFKILKLSANEEVKTIKSDCAKTDVGYKLFYFLILYLHKRKIL